jgi:tetratricopeptide (TPR) repeat protein
VLPAAGEDPAGPANTARRRHAPLSTLAAFLGTRAGLLLIGVSVYREPADRNAVLFQVGEHDYAAARDHDLLGPASPFRPPADLADLTTACLRAGLLQRRRTGRRGDVPALLVDERVGHQLREILDGAGRHAELTDAHRRAADYWQWRAAAWPQERQADIHDLLQARQHLLDAGEIDQASSLTRDICAQLRVWGSLDSEAELIQATLEALPSPSAGRAGWLHELGAVAQAHRDFVAAERHYLSSVAMFEQLEDAGGVARGYESLGVLAQAQGDYRKAERRYRAAAASQKRAGPAADDSMPWAAGSAAAPGAASAGTVLDPGPALPPAPPAAPAQAELPVPHGTVPPARPARRHKRFRTASPPASRPARPGRWARRAHWPVVLAVVSAGVALTATTVAVARVATGPGPGPQGTAGTRLAPGQDAVTRAGQGQAGSLAAAVAGDRARAAAWITAQVSRSAVVACDPAMAADLRARGVPAGNLLVLGPGAGADPLGSGVVIATSAVRSELGGRLASVYAPLVIARFGAGSGRIEVRVEAPDGAALYQRALRSDQQARRAGGTQLVRNHQLSVSPAARRELLAGQVDTRLLTTIAALAQLRQFRIAGFSDSGPAGNAAAPLRSAEITVAGSAGSAAVAPLRAFLAAQRAPYLAAHIAVIQGPGGPELSFTFPAPSPLGLLAGPGSGTAGTTRP